jgi:hypothetical protein
MRSLHFAFPLAPLAAALILGACATNGAGVPAASTPPVTPAGGAAGATASPTTTPTKAPSTAPSATPTPGAAKIPFKKLSYEGGAAEEGKPLPVTANKRLKTQAELTALLDQVKAEKTGRPTVDFAKQEVLAFYDEGGNNGCYELVLLELQNKGAVIQPVFQEKPEPGDTDRICTQQLVLPHYLLVAIDRSPLPVAGVDQAPASPSPTPSTK